MPKHSGKNRLRKDSPPHKRRGSRSRSPSPPKNIGRGRKLDGGAFGPGTRKKMRARTKKELMAVGNAFGQDLDPDEKKAHMVWRLSTNPRLKKYVKGAGVATGGAGLLALGYAGVKKMRKTRKDRPHTNKRTDNFRGIVGRGGGLDATSSSSISSSYPPTKNNPKVLEFRNSSQPIEIRPKKGDSTEHTSSQFYDVDFHFIERERERDIMSKHKSED